MTRERLERLARYRIERKLGQGAMGSVYLARDEKIGRLVALKVLCAEDFDNSADAAEALRRFRQEGRAAGNLGHPNIVTIYDVLEDGPYSFIAMEFIDGPTLAKFTTKDQLLPIKDALSITAQAARALAYAHRHGIIHRDIKPANLMLTSAGVFKIADFGLAKECGANLTRGRTIIGTPNYMSPEQIRGEPLDGRSDLFSLGVVGAELLCGRRPFLGDTIPAVIYKILNEEPRLASGRLPELPSGTVPFLVKALAKDRTVRFSSGEEMADGLEQLAASVAGETGIPGRPPRAAAVSKSSEESIFPEPPTRPRSEPGMAGPLPDAARGRMRSGPSVGTLRPSTSGASPSRSFFRKKGVWLSAAVGVSGLSVILALMGLAPGGIGQRIALMFRGLSRSVRVEAPPGAELLLNGQVWPRGSDGGITLPPGPGPFRLQARSTCAESATVVASPGQSDPVELSTSRARRLKVPLQLPPGVRVAAMDGVPLPAGGEAVLEVEMCQPHTLELARDGYQNSVISLPASRDEADAGAFASKIASAPLSTTPRKVRVCVRAGGAAGVGRIEAGGNECVPSDESGCFLCLPQSEVTFRVVNCERLLDVSQPRTVPANDQDSPWVIESRPVQVTLLRPSGDYFCEYAVGGCGPVAWRRDLTVSRVVSGFAGDWRFRCAAPAEVAPSWRSRRIETGQNWPWAWE